MIFKVSYALCFIACLLAITGYIFYKNNYNYWIIFTNAAFCFYAASFAYLSIGM